MTKPNNTIAVTFPCHGGVLPLSALTLMANVGMLASRGWRVVSACGQSSIVANARNQCVEAAQSNRADWLFMLDTDIQAPTNTILRLLDHNVDIVGATYRRRTSPFEIMGKAVGGTGSHAITGLHEMELIPTGCLLIRMSVFDRLSRPYFRFGVDTSTQSIISEDYVFCRDARAAGFRLWCDTDLSASLVHWGTSPIPTEAK